MKTLQKIIILAGVALGASCNQGEEVPQATNTFSAAAESKPDWKPPVAGTVVDKYEKRIANTRLYDAFFRVSVITTDSSPDGHYTLRAEYGGAVHEVPYDLPEWNDDRILKPVIKADTVAYGCLIGFDSGDGSFRPYYRIVAQNTNGDMVVKQVATYMLSR